MSPRQPAFTHRVTLQSGAVFLAVSLAQSPLEVWARGVWVDSRDKHETHRWGRESVASVEPLTLLAGEPS